MSTIKSKSHKTRYLLLNYIRSDNINGIKYLLENKIDININKRIRYHTPLSLAIKHNRLEIIKLLIKHGAIIELSHILCNINNKDINIIEFLLDYNNICNIDIYKYKEWLNKALKCILEIKHYEDGYKILELLIKKGVDVNIIGFDGLTPLIYSLLYSNDIKTFKLLIDNGADINIETTVSVSLVRKIFNTFDINVVNLFIESNIVNNMYSLMLTLIIFNNKLVNKLEYIKSLIDRGMKYSLIVEYISSLMKLIDIVDITNDIKTLIESIEEYLHTPKSLEYLCMLFVKRRVSKNNINYNSLHLPSNVIDDMKKL